LRFFNVNINFVHKLENALRKNKGPFLFFGKLSHAIGGIILFAAGSVGIPVGDFLWFNFLATLPKSLILILVGYYFGSTVSNFKRYVDITALGLFVFTLVLIGIYFAVTYFSNKYLSKLEK
jgi:membrane protein DedA with SNARE-associated domain